MNIFKKRSGRATLGTLTLLLISAQGAWGQAGRGGVSGTVTDSSGAVVPGASVELTNIETGVTLTTVTTGSGLYSFVSLVPARYCVTAKHPGFTSAAQDKVTETAGRVTAGHITL